MEQKHKILLGGTAVIGGVMIIGSMFLSNVYLNKALKKSTRFRVNSIKQ